MKTTKYTTPKGRLVVTLETDRQATAPGEFFALLEDRESVMADLSDRYLIEDAPGHGFGQTYAAPEFSNLEDAGEYADQMENKGDEMSQIAKPIAK